jgi:hypothetical protein
MGDCRWFRDLGCKNAAAAVRELELKEDRLPVIERQAASVLAARTSHEQDFLNLAQVNADGRVHVNKLTFSHHQ